MVEQNRFKNDSFDRLPIADVPHLRKLAETYRDDPDFTTDFFFSLALRGFYDAMWDGLNATAGHIIYRLSDTIEKPQRETMDIYPSPTGSIIFEHKSGKNHGYVDRWDSLEDWRKQWERLHPVIPEYTKQLPGGFSLEKPKDLS